MSFRRLSTCSVHGSLCIQPITAAPVQLRSKHSLQQHIRQPAHATGPTKKKKKRHTYGTTSLCQHRFKQGTTFSKPSKQAWIKHKAQTGSEAPFHRASPPLRQIGGGHRGFLEVRHGSGVIQSAGKAESSVQLPLRNKKHMLGSDIWSDCLQ